MKILSGAYKGIELTAPQDGAVRPTVDHFKKHILRLAEGFSVAVVWDLFAGSGGVGLEFLSRGARQVVFVEQTRAALSCLNLNLAECRLRAPEAFTGQAVHTVQGPVEKFLSNPVGFGVTETPDLIFLDPPYGQNWVAKVLPMVFKCPLVGSRTVVLCEHVADDPVPHELKSKIAAEETYGPKTLTVLKN